MIHLPAIPDLPTPPEFGGNTTTLLPSASPCLRLTSPKQHFDPIGPLKTNFGPTADMPTRPNFGGVGISERYARKP